MNQGTMDGSQAIVTTRTSSSRAPWRHGHDRGASTFAALLTILLLTTSALAQPPSSVRLGVAGPIENLDPRANLRPSERQAISGVYEALLRLSPAYALEPGLATRWTLAEDGMSLELELRADVRFHDGSAFDAEDVRATLTTALEGGPVVGIETPDAHIVVLRFDRPSSTMLFALTRIPMLPAEAAAAPGTPPAGTGPYALTGTAITTPLRLHRNDGYWGGTSAFADVEIHAFTDREALVDAMARGRLDATQARLSAADVQRLSNVRGMTTDVVAGTAVEYVVVNTQSAPLDDPRVRAALAHLMPRERIVELATGRLLVGQSTPIGPEATWWTPALERAFDPARAAELLEEAAATFDRPLTLVTNGTAERMLIAEQVETALGRHGVRVSSEIVEFRDLLDRAGSGRFDLLVFGIDYGGDPIGTVLNAVRGFVTAAPTFSDASARERADLLARLDPSTDTGAAALADVLALLADEATPIFLVATAEVAALRTDFGEAHAHPVAAFAFQELLGTRAP